LSAASDVKICRDEWYSIGVNLSLKLLPHKRSPLTPLQKGGTGKPEIFLKFPLKRGEPEIFLKSPFLRGI
jgi:hypothetical protein